MELLNSYASDSDDTGSDGNGSDADRSGATNTEQRLCGPEQLKPRGEEQKNERENKNKLAEKSVAQDLGVVAIEKSESLGKRKAPQNRLIKIKRLKPSIRPGLAPPQVLRRVPNIVTEDNEKWNSDLTNRRRTSVRLG